MKKIKSFSFIGISIILISIFISSCSSTTMITSEPQKAKVYINNAFVGSTPYAMTDKKLATECTSIRLEKEGYQDMITVICRDEEISTGAFIGGIFVWPLWLWIYDYYPEHNYILRPINSNDISDYNRQLEYTVDDDVPQINKPQQSTKANKLQELKKLYDEGILTKDEYEKEKQKILEQEEW